MKTYTSTKNNKIDYIVSCSVCFIVSGNIEVKSISTSAIETVTKETTSNKHDNYAWQYCTK